MAHLLTGGEKCRDLIHNDDHRSYLGAYRLGQTEGKRVGGRTRLSRVNGYLKNIIEAIANAKLRRMRRELELRGIRYENDDWIKHNPQATEPSR
jgi:hypothetical protein